MARTKRTPTPPTLGSVNTVPVGGIENDPLRKLLQQIIAGAADCGPAAKPLLACVAALEDAQRIRWKMADKFQSKMTREAIKQQGAMSVLAQTEQISDAEKARRLEAARQAIVGGIGDAYRDEFFATYQRFVDAGASVEKVIAQAEADFVGFDSLKSGDKRALIDVLKDQEVGADVDKALLERSWDVLQAATKAGSSDVIRRLVPHIEKKAMRVMRASPADLAKSEILGNATDDSLNRVRTVAMRVLSYCQAYRDAQKPPWISLAREAWAVLDQPRRQLFGPSVDYLAPGATSPDKGFRVARWLDWKTLEIDCHTRFLTWPVKLAGWSAPVALDHRPNAAPGQVVREEPGGRLPFNVQSVRGSR